MTFEQRLRVAEFRQNLVFGHRLSLCCSLAEIGAGEGASQLRAKSAKAAA